MTRKPSTASVSEMWEMIDYDDDDVPGVYTDNMFLMLQWWYAVGSNQLYMPTRFEGL